MYENNEKMAKTENYILIIKRIFTILILSLFSIYALWQKLELFSIVAVLLLVCFIYKETSNKYLETAFDLLNDIKKAKYGNFEFERFGEKLEKIRDNTEVILMQNITSKLEAKHKKLLLDIRSGYYTNNKHAIIEMIEELRYLRQLGLIRHNSSLLANSETVSLSELGEMIAKSLEPIKDSHLHQ